MAEFAFQHTVRSPVRFAGIGVHTGEQARVTLLPAPADTGVVFIRTDVRDRDNRIAVSGEAVCRTQLGTVITNAAGVTVSTIEHLMAALVMTGVDNALVEIDGPEMPIMDGSSIDFIRGLDRAGLQPQGAPRRFIEIVDVVEVIEGDKRATLRPSEGFEVAFEIAFASAAIGRQAVDLKMDAGAFRRELADCRTFGFLHEVEALRAMGLARGGSMDNAVVIDGDEIMNPEGLRRPDEFVRHKALDAIGDLYVLGAPVIGRFEGVLAGHALNNAVVRALLATPHAWRVRTLAEEMAEAV
ncbi:MAG: UDP-3-O-acyl-N-acetylglucosamine deacetylase [Phenylobacterium sp.]|uniref:UDP-3-O-acyl-N-acetylglucosamine deacetylase n=1 Tax=Phenylobacterium sp. TaxID=1871053 RepID=UPI0025CCEBDA|nr:UDP-3-O-acyl-N-acetylglucosamine deacetylase [Phenylobacterium sp.]MCA3708615.1 UDP-3-O-acyl-N-acetylglucosamine deacetylase [Phenylobacterium sp.]MCA3711000.1 UDP-3-O-acyl-N-acetylglucosamine deacetylase [Phenylobacterium sp.]MCA3714061.1 UDP-3-O-acyl-N-acetylglucosamine deacetylase [Phenylobacterium sp.]MCA3723435.1 UDP-3-O-acyl-N-acetylglucosamine deacetylase [Phenylobacterium sp.]MCA3725419.1 UDP-3-O-acyl-N-acetylglucosamine deacetylase [Phenylobacterium sp.]